jgi:hypothetical protein
VGGRRGGATRNGLLSPWATRHNLDSLIKDFMTPLSCPEEKDDFTKREAREERLIVES